MTNQERIARIQAHLGLEADGILGAVTLTAMEQALGLGSAAKPRTDLQVTPAPGKEFHLVVTRSGLDMIIDFETGGQAYYDKFLAKPSWPGGASGVTIGVGFDLGYYTRAEVEQIWGKHVSESNLIRLKAVAGLTGQAAKGAAAEIKSGVKIDLSTAKIVFAEATLPDFAERTRKAYPGVEKLPADAQSMLLSLVYNRGPGMTGDRRAEMRNIRPLVVSMDLEGIAKQFQAMKRLWSAGSGLLKRRDDEAKIIRASQRAYQDDELVFV